MSTGLWLQKVRKVELRFAIPACSDMPQYEVWDLGESGTRGTLFTPQNLRWYTISDSKFN
jgi:hypothetical protein